MSIFRSRFAAAFMAVAAIVPGLLILGCDGDGLDFGSRELPAIGSKTLTIYGRVNQFAWADGATVERAAEILHSEIRALAAAGWDGYQIELWGWVRYADITPEEGMDRIRVVFPLLVNWCREEGLWLFISGVNDNQHLGKYGSTARWLSQDAAQVEECLQLIVAAGPANLIVQPVGETQTSDGANIEDRWSSALDPLGFYLVNNDGSRPSSTQSWSDAYCVHVWSVDEAKTVEPAAWVNNDTHLGIVDMSADGTDSGPCDPDEVAGYVSDARAAGRPAAMVYAFGYSGAAGLDVAAIGAIE